jgi:hypothetical protein
VVDPGKANSGPTADALAGMPRQNLLAFQVGVIF